ncbi:MAG: substrate-binding domain-containing protein [Lachnospiraceae bacterium]|nr:substrate-binding domain-containing protein [Lachnospiraceae bacterium]
MAFTAVILAGLLFFYQRTDMGRKEEKGDYQIYQRHYAMITGKEDSDFWDKVYQSAMEEGKTRGAYVERFGEHLAVEYSCNELIELAVKASVDGIIVPGDEDQETIRVINTAVECGIPVVTVFRDSTGSLRQCFVGNNSYDLGQDYGRQIIQLMEKNEHTSGNVLVLVNENRMDTRQNLILLGIRETLEREFGEGHAVSVETVPINHTRSFSSEESIRDIFLNSEKLPNILVCLNAVHTQCAYQAAVDYNQVGSVQILGYYDSDTILNAVAKHIIYSTVALDTEQMGVLCVQSLDEYIETGYTNGYMAVDTRWITGEDAERLAE